MGFWETGSLGLHPPRLLDDSPDKVGPWDGIKTTLQHARKRTLVAAGRMPVRGKGNGLKKK